MIAHLLHILTIVAPVILVTGMGYAWRRSGREFPAQFVASFAMTVATPCLAVASFVQSPPPLEVLDRFGLAAALALLALVATSWLGLRLFGGSVRDHLPALSFPNVGNMGLPICLFAYGKEGLGLALVFMLLAIVAQFTFGVGLASGRVRPQELLRTPMIYTAVVVVVLVVSEYRPPDWLVNTADLVGDTLIPLMLMALGVSLAELGVASVRRSCALAVGRLAGGLAIGFGLAWLLGLEGAARGVLVLQCSMPIAVFSYLIAARFGRAIHDVAGGVVVSTLLSLLILPVLLLALDLPGAGH